MKKKTIKEMEYEFQFEEMATELPPKEVFTFNELRSCSDLFRMHQKKILEIKPVYQRDIVWGNADRTRFVDSLLKRLPIPSLCFSQDSNTNKMQVIDGLQRIDTICRLFDDKQWRLSAIDDVDKRISGKTVENINLNNPEIISDIENFALSVTLLRCDYTKSNHIEYVFTIFKRLNTGGLKLTNQEIRNAIFSGPFNDLLKECNELSDWKLLLERTTGQKNKDDRFKSIETILKFFAFYDRASKYKTGLLSYLNDYMKDNRYLEQEKIKNKKNIFNRSVILAINNIFDKKPPSRLNGATFEAIFHGIAKNIDVLEKVAKTSNKAEIIKRYKKIINNPILSTENLSEGLYQRQKVLDRFSLAEEIFSKKS